jgi:hypothetical protein
MDCDGNILSQISVITWEGSGYETAKWVLRWLAFSVELEGYRNRTV